MARTVTVLRNDRASAAGSAAGSSRSSSSSENTAAATSAAPAGSSAQRGQECYTPVLEHQGVGLSNPRADIEGLGQLGGRQGISIAATVCCNRVCPPHTPMVMQVILILMEPHGFDELEVWVADPQREAADLHLKGFTEGGAHAEDKGSQPEVVQGFWPLDGESHDYLLLLGDKRLEVWRDGALVVRMPGKCLQQKPGRMLGIGDSGADYENCSSIRSISNIRIWDRCIPWTVAFGRKRKILDDAESTSKLRSMWESRRFTDAVICTEKATFCVHRVVLAEGSPVFAAMFETDAMREGAERKVLIENVPPSATENMLRYMYSCQVEENCDMCALLRLADQYQVQGLVRLCCDALADAFCDETAVATLRSLRPLRHHSVVHSTWEAVLRRLGDEESLRRVLAEAV